MDWSPLVGVPFRERGRDLAGCDCYGLVALAYRLGREIELPSFHENYSGAADKAEIARLLADEKATAWRAIEPGEEQPFDAVETVVGGDQHIGTVVRRGLMLHVLKGCDSVIEPYSTGRYGKVRFYRYEPA